MSERMCPHCRQPINDDDALLCHFCGESLGRTSSGMMGMMAAGKWIIAVVILTVFALMMFR